MVGDIDAFPKLARRRGCKILDELPHSPAFTQPPPRRPDFRFTIDTLPASFTFSAIFIPACYISLHTADSLASVP